MVLEPAPGRVPPAGAAQSDASVERADPGMPRIATKQSCASTTGGRAALSSIELTVARRARASAPGTDRNRAARPNRGEDAPFPVRPPDAGHDRQVLQEPQSGSDP